MNSIKQLANKLAEYIEKTYDKKRSDTITGILSFLLQGHFSNEEIENIIELDDKEIYEGILDFSKIDKVVKTDFKELLPKNIDEMLIITFDDEYLAQVALGILGSLGVSWFTSKLIPTDTKWPINPPENRRGRSYYIDSRLDIMHAHKDYAIGLYMARGREGLTTYLRNF